MDLLENEIFAQWQDIKEVFFIDDIADFAEKLRQLAIEYDMDILADYSRKLHESAQKSHLEEIEKLLAEFPGVIETLRKI